MYHFNEYLIKEAEDNLIRFQEELDTATGIYWEAHKRLSGTYEGRRYQQYEDMMVQFSALSQISSYTDLLVSTADNIEAMYLEDKLAREAWLTGHYESVDLMYATAQKEEILILDHKNTDYHNQHHFIVLAHNNEREYVTFHWANGAFHKGHYFGADAVDAQTDFKTRN